MNSILRYEAEDLQPLCDRLAATDPVFANIISEWGYPPVWTRPNTYETLVLTILEQQVSLASAYAAYTRLKQRIGITPQNLLQLSDEELRACSFTRQKMAYTRGLAEAMVSGEISLEHFEHMEDSDVRTALKKLKGIGDWTVDIYLIHALRRTDIWPLGDLALVNAVKMTKGLSSPTKEALNVLAEPWKPWRSIATMLFWHYYIRKKNIKLLH